MTRNCRGVKNRACSGFVSNQMVLFKKNVTIIQQRSYHRRPTQNHSYQGVKTVNQTNNTLDSFFKSDGFGQPQSSNRKLRTFNSNKLEINNTSPNIQNLSKNKQDVTNGQKYSMGFMFQSQARKEANVGSMDRLLRLKAQNIKNYSNY